MLTLKLMDEWQALLTLIRCHILQHLIWVCIAEVYLFMVNTVNTVMTNTTILFLNMMTVFFFLFFFFVLFF